MCYETRTTFVCTNSACLESLGYDTWIMRYKCAEAVWIHGMDEDDAYGKCGGASIIAKNSTLHLCTTCQAAVDIQMNINSCEQQFM